MCKCTFTVDGPHFCHDFCLNFQVCTHLLLNIVNVIILTDVLKYERCTQPRHDHPHIALISADGLDICEVRVRARRNFSCLTRATHPVVAPRLEYPHTISAAQLTLARIAAGLNRTNMGAEIKCHMYSSHSLRLFATVSNNQVIGLI